MHFRNNSLLDRTVRVSVRQPGTLRNSPTSLEQQANERRAWLMLIGQRDTEAFEIYNAQGLRQLQNITFFRKVQRTGAATLFLNFVRTLWMEGFTRTEPPLGSLLRWPCPLPFDHAIPVLWQNLESNV